MRKLRHRIAAAATGVLSVPFLASAAHASGCPMVTDALGDGYWVQQSIQSPTFDIRSIDLASGASTLVVVLRVGALPSGRVDDLFGAYQTYAVGWTIGTTTYAVRAVFGRTSVTSSFVLNNVAVPAPLALDYSTGELTWTLARGDVPGLTGATLTLPRAFTSWDSTSTDQAFDGSATYVDGTAGCVPAA